MRSLGSNFLLDGSSLGITIEKPFEVLIKNKDLINDESNSVEPLENAENTIKDGAESTQKTIWWARRESNPHSLNGNWILSPACLPFHHSPVMIKNFGAPGRNWTCDLCLRRALLYPLSYGCNNVYFIKERMYFKYTNIIEKDIANEVCYVLLNSYKK